MIRYVGLDLHKRSIKTCFQESGGKALERPEVACTRDAILEFARTALTQDDHLALEATFNTWPVVDLLEPFVAELVVANPLKTKLIAESRVKTDKVDAEVLAHLLRTGFIAPVWKPDAQTRLLRNITGRRSSIVSDRTTIKNRLHSVLHHRLIHVPVTDLFSTRGLTWLRNLELDEYGRRAVDSELRLLEATQHEIDSIDLDLARRGHGDERVRLLMTLPGVDVAAAQTVIAALGDISRFPDGDHVASYLGLCSRTRQSAEHCYHGPITKMGNSSARWMLTQAAQHVASHPGPLGAFYHRVAKRKGRNVAIVAVARKMATIVWHLLTKREAYRYALPRTTEHKLTKLRVKATGERQKTGPKPGTKPINYGTGKRTRLIPSLQEICAAEQVPPPVAPADLAAGELRFLEHQGLLPFARQVRDPMRIPKSLGKRIKPPQEGANE